MISLNLYKNKNILITGGLGFIGSNLAIKLVKLGAKIAIVDSMIPDYGGNLFNIESVKNKVKLSFSDIRDRSSMNYMVRNQDFLFNLAGQISHLDSMTDPFTDLEINCQAQLSLLEACRKNNPKIKIIYASTRQFYGKPKYLPVDEKHPLNPPDVNGINKLAGEQYHLLYYKVYGIKSTALRLTNTYGPRLLLKHNRQGFMAWFISKILRGETIEIYGTGKQIRDLNYVDDAAAALLLAGASHKAYGQIFNLGGKPISLLKLAKIMIKIAGKGKYKLIPAPQERKKIDIGDFYGDYTKIKKTLGWKPTVGLEQGLKNTFDYYKKYLKYYV